MRARARRLRRGRRARRGRDARSRGRGCHRTLRGSGLGLIWEALYAITLRVALAWRIGDPPVVDPDNDNPRVLAQIQKAF